MTGKRKGSTTAPTVSSHGSNPEQGIKNMQSNNTEQPGTAIENPWVKARRLSRELSDTLASIGDDDRPEYAMVFPDASRGYRFGFASHRDTPAIKIADLSFVADRDGKKLPKAKKGEKRRCFWHVEATGDFMADNEIGYRLAMEYLWFDNSPHGSGCILGLIVGDMPTPLTGVEIGFLSIIGFAARDGIDEAERILRHWGFSPSEWTAGYLSDLNDARRANA